MQIVCFQVISMLVFSIAYIPLWWLYSRKFVAKFLITQLACCQELPK
jgi:hypothetical protein